MSATIDNLDKDMTALQSAVLEDPVKALELPLLRRDLENARVANDAGVQSVKADIERQYDLMKWLVGTFALGMLGMLATVLTAIVKGVQIDRGGAPTG